jgi:hypothetical protein
MSETSDRPSPAVRCLLALLPLLAFARPVGAQQVFESVGERALGMAGAFVAVADDSTAVHWNPAGLAVGRPVGMTIGWYRSQSGNRLGPPVPGPTAGDNRFTSLGTWPLGVSYGRFASSALEADLANGLQVRTLRTSHAGVTVLQTIVEGLVAGATLKYVRGSVAVTPATGLTAEDALKEGARAEAQARGTIDLDFGLMADMERLRVGVTWKNLRSPQFTASDGVVTTLPRQARLGVAVLPSDGVTLAMDIDLDTVDLRGDPRRMVALGGESRLGRRLAVRSGVRWDLEGDRLPVGAAGLSLVVRAGLWLDGHYAQGRSKEDREFGVAFRAGF